MSTWHKVGSNGEYRVTLVLPDEFELWIMRLEAERDEARRWAAHFYRLWKAFDTPANEKPFTVNVTGLNHLQQAIEDAKPAVAEAMREAAKRTAERVTGKPTVASKGRKAKVAK